MTPEQEQEFLLRYLEKKVKELYRDSLVLRKAQEILREDVPAFAEIVEDIRKSHETEVQVALFDVAISAKLPSPLPVDEETAWQKWIQDRGLDQGTHH